MSRRGKHIFKQGTRSLRLGKWLRRLGMKQNQVADSLRITESYVSDLVNDPTVNPSPVLLLELSELLDITVNDLYNDPPDGDDVDNMGGVGPKALKRLRQNARR